MQIEIDPAKFASAHEAFLHHAEMKSNGMPFVNFQHEFLVNTEIAYKWKIYADAKDILQLSKWSKWRSTSGKILQAVKGACVPTVSQNLLEHKYGFENSSEGALYKVTTSDEIKGLENQMFDFFLGGKATSDEFSVRFDSFANYLRTNHLGCNWAFIAYLAFLSQPQAYFPIRPSHFEKLLKFYGVDEDIVGFVSWERYNLLLNLAEKLKSNLAMYGTLDSIEIQSYMWVVANLVAEQKIGEVRPEPSIDFNAELASRIQQASERERIGLLGEQFVFQQEMSKLINASRQDLAKNVKIVSSQTDLGYDIVSYSVSGQTLHIEVKTTSRTKNSDDGFWLSGYEKQIASQDENWTLYRVWNINREPSLENLGNIFCDNPEQWEILPSTWFVKLKI